MPWIKETTSAELGQMFDNVWKRMAPMHITNIAVIQGKVLITFESPQLPALEDGEYRHIDELGVIMSTANRAGG